MENVVLQSLKERRSVRSYSPRQVDEESLRAILEAGTYAATGMNRQSPIMVVVQDPVAREALRKINAAILGTPEADPFYGAPTVVVILADANVSTYLEDGSLVIGNLMNAAHAVGVDSCWIHRAKQTFATEEGKHLLKEWGVEGNYVGVGHCILGYRKGERPETKPRKENYIYRV